MQMKHRSRYVFGSAIATVAIGGIPGLIHQANAVIITSADFTFDSNSAAASSSTTGISYLADIGTGTAYGVHANNSTFTFSSGNGSYNSLSANNFAAGDYFEFAVPTTSLASLIVSFDTVASSTGPASFELAYSTDGTNFSSYSSFIPIHATSLVSYNATYDGTVAASIGSTKNDTSFSNSFSASSFNFAFDLSTIPGLTNDPNAAFELIALTSGAATGTTRIDNFIVSGSSVPEPASLALMSLAAASALVRRRKN
jgi:hypothetical protein